MNNLVEFRNVKKSYGRKAALTNCSFHLKQGTITGLIGPNGSGKTTTMKLLTGLIQPTEGEILFRGKKLSSQIRNLTALIEEPRFYPHLTGYQNLNYFLAYNPSISDDQIREMVRRLHMESYIDEKVGKYSLGMRQRLGLVYALSGNADLIVLDEPMNGLDPIGMKTVREILKDYVKKQQGTVFISSHLLLELQNLCDEIIILNEGRVISQFECHYELIYHMLFFHPNECAKAFEEMKRIGYDVQMKGSNLFIPIHNEKDIASIIQKLSKYNLKEVKPLEANLEQIYLKTIVGDAKC